MEETTALVVKRIDEIERRDEAQILAMMAGELITEYTYSFRDGRGRFQRNLSWAGIREMAQLRGNIIVDEPIIEEREDHWRIIVRASDMVRNVSVWGGTHQPKLMRVKDTETGEVYEEEDRFAFEKGLSKAQRNAIKNLMPVTVIQEMIGRLKGERKMSPKGQAVVDKLTGQEGVSHKPKGEGVVHRDISMIKTHNDFNVACFEDFEIQPAAALKLTGYPSKMDVPDWASAYTQVAGVKGMRVEVPEEREEGEEEEIAPSDLPF